MLLNANSGSEVRGEFGAKITLPMASPSSSPPNVVTELGMVSEVMVPVWVQPVVATAVTGNPLIVDGIVTDAPEHVASQPVIAAEVPSLLVHSQPLLVPELAKTPVPTVVPLGTVGVELKLL